MNRRLSMLCLLVIAVALLFATGAWARDVPFQLRPAGVAMMTGQLEGLPLLDVSTWGTVALPNKLGVTKWFAIWKLDPVTGAVSEGQMVDLTDDGDVLYSHVTGQWLPPDPQTGLFEALLNLEYLGGTGRFAGARGSATSTSWHRFLSPVEASVEEGALVSGTASLPKDLDQKMKMVRIHEEQTLVPGGFVQEPEAWPLLFVDVWHEGTSDFWGIYVSERRELMDMGPLFASPPGPAPGWGFDTITAADGDVCYTFWQGEIAPFDAFGDFSVDLKLWLVGGTGKYASTNGYLTGGGPSYADGYESFSYKGKVSQ